jgi:hypothetical protein
MRNPLTMLFIVAAALMSLLGTATADTAAVPRPAAAPGWTLTPASDISIQALSCPSGNMCVWPVIDGSRNRCSWSNADNDWRTAPVTCSWSRDQPVKAIYNHGTSTIYDGVCLYRGANYTSFEVFVPQGSTATNSTGAILQSHRWVRPTDPC